MNCLNHTFFFFLGQKTNTPMRKLIQKMPSVAVEVFGKCMSDNGRNIDDPKYEVCEVCIDLCGMLVV